MKAIDLEEIKSLELDILVQIDSFCPSHHVRYYLAYGTLLGAVRHGGFIPWDDDIDIAMPREDYERFYRAFPAENTVEHLRLVSYRDKSSIYPYLKVVDDRTIVEVAAIRRESHTGVWVDIFPIDGLPKDNKPFQVVDRLSGWSPWVIGRPAGATTLLRRFVKQVVNPFVKNFDLYRQCAKIDAVAASAPITPGGEVAQIIGGFGSYERMPSEYLEQTEIEFEGQQFFATSMWDHYLRAAYGDYMTPPPEDQRIPHATAAFWKN